MVIPQKYYLLFCLLVLFSVPVIAQFDSPIQQIKFRKLTNDNGLSQGTINSIAQDSIGFIWIGTNDGLNRYDGFKIKVFRNNTLDSNTIRSNTITKIFITKNNTIWIGTDKGLDYLDMLTGQIHHINNDFLNSSTPVSDIASDRAGNMWVATKNAGLIQLIKNPDAPEMFAQATQVGGFLPYNKLSCIYLSSDQVLWIGFYNGEIAYLDKATKKFKHIDPHISTLEELQLNVVTGFVEDKNKNLWISTYGRGLLHLDTHTLKLTQINASRPSENPISYILSSLVFDNDSTLWLGTDLDGLAKYNISSQKLEYFHEGNESHNVLYRTIKTLFKDKDGNIWIGTYGKGLNIIPAHKDNFYSITSGVTELTPLMISSVRSIYEEADNLIWIGGYRGLQKLNLATNKTEAYHDLIAYTLCPDLKDKNTLWVGTEGSGIMKLNLQNNKVTKIPPWNKLHCSNHDSIPPGGLVILDIKNKDSESLYLAIPMGLFIYHKASKSFKYFGHDANDSTSIPEGMVNTVYFDRNNNTWVTTTKGGLAKFDPLTETFVDYQNSIARFKQNIHHINCMYQDTKNQFWLGTTNGLFKIDFQDNSIRSFHEKDGLPNNVIYGILEDAFGKLWLSTNMGLVCFDTEKEWFTSFDKSYGLPSNEFNSAAFFQKNHHRLYFGSVDGLVYFDPAKIHQPTTSHQAIVTEALLPNENAKRDFTTAYKNEITLQPGQNNVVLYFASLQYFVPGVQNFAFKINGQSKSWVNLGKERSMTLTSLKPGKHVLSIQSINNRNDLVSKSSVFHIIVLPLFYQTTGFRITLVLLFMSMATFLYIARNRMTRQNQLKLEKLVKQRTLEFENSNRELELANEAKNKFFSIIAHDLKSPFNSMIGFSNILVDDWAELDNAEKLEFIKILKSTTEDTYQLLINLLEWSRVQEKQINFDPEQINLSELLETCTRQLQADAFLKNIRIRVSVPPELSLYADEHMLDTVFRNLISNAIKFTPKNGQIFIEVKENENEVECCVTDNGIGMTEAEIETLFKLQYRNSNKGTEGESGTGLGLVLCHEFIKKHNGKFTVKSKPGKGSNFCFVLPRFKA